MLEFLNRATMMAFASCGLFFLKSWRTTHDRLFVMFAAAFWLLAF